MEKPTGKRHCGSGIFCYERGDSDNRCLCGCLLCSAWNAWLYDSLVQPNRSPALTGSGDYSIGSKVWPGMSKVIEEMGELAQVFGKLMGTGGEPKHWDGSNLRERLIEELADVYAAVQFFAANNLTKEEQFEWAKRIGKKRELFDEWHAGGTHGVAR